MTLYHKPVMLSEALEFLNIHPIGIYVDATLGGGGHTEAILKTCSKISLYSFDQDPEAIAFCQERFKNNYPNLILIKDNFQNLRTRLSLERIRRIDGILFDLGVSSHQIDSSQRGFSFEKDSELDMRMNPDQGISAREIVNTFDRESLKRIFYDYGEEKEAGRITNAIIKLRMQQEIVTTLQLARIIEKIAHSPKKQKTKARIFQALRIYVNGELDKLKSALRDSVNILNPGGRIVVISYHSLEDRIVKRFFLEEQKDCICPPNFPKCVCDKQSRLKVLTKKPVRASEREISINLRARSARMRAAEKKEV